MPSVKIRTSYLVAALSTQSINGCLPGCLWEQFYFLNTHTHTFRRSVVYSTIMKVLFHSPVFPQNKRSTNKQSANYKCQCFDDASVFFFVFFLKPFGCSIALFSSFFLCKTSRIIIFDFSTSPTSFLLCLQPHQRKTLICTSSSTAVGFKQPPWSRRKLVSLPKYRCEVWKEQVH